MWRIESTKWRHNNGIRNKQRISAYQLATVIMHARKYEHTHTKEAADNCTYFCFVAGSSGTGLWTWAGTIGSRCKIDSNYTSKDTITNSSTSTSTSTSNVTLGVSRCAYTTVATLRAAIVAGTAKVTIVCCIISTTGIINGWSMHRCHRSGIIHSAGRRHTLGHYNVQMEATEFKIENTVIVLRQQ